MTIRTRLTLLFTALMAVVLGVILVAVYALSEANTRNEFYGRLKERTTIAANVFLETDELARQTLIEFNTRYLITLPDEIVFLIDSSGTHRFVETTRAPVQPSLTMIDAVRSAGAIQEFDKGTQRYGTYYHDNQGDFVIIAQARDIFGQSKLDNLRLVLLGAFGTGVLLAFFAGMMFARSALRPMNVVINRVDSITASTLGERVEGGETADEIGHLVRTFNDMLERLGDSFRKQQEFVANASHELRTPLTSIVGCLEVQLARARTIEESRESNMAVLAEARRLSTIVDALLLMAQASDDSTSMQRVPIRLDEMLLDAVGAARQRYGTNRIMPRLTVNSDNADSVTIDGYPTLLRVALDNVIDNAMKYSSEDVIVELLADAEACSFVISDSGIGVRSDELAKIGSLFYRSANAKNAHGYGIGLALTGRLVEAHNGSVHIQSVEGQGTVVTICFQAARTKDPH